MIFKNCMIEFKRIVNRFYFFSGSGCQKNISVKQKKILVFASHKRPLIGVTWVVKKVEFTFHFWSGCYRYPTSLKVHSFGTCFSSPVLDLPFKDFLKHRSHVEGKKNGYKRNIFLATYKRLTKIIFWGYKLSKLNFEFCFLLNSYKLIWNKFSLKIVSKQKILIFVAQKHKILDSKHFFHSRLNFLRQSIATWHPNRFMWNFSTLFDLSAPLKKSIHACLVT